jgi:PhoPQ-activated pathogenicity-related protein
VIVTSGDEFFLADDTHFFWNDLLNATDGTAMLRRLPNAEHSLTNQSQTILNTFESFFLSSYEVKMAQFLFEN